MKKAFLKGVSYQELAESLGEEERDVDFDMSPDAVDTLRKIPEVADCDPSLEVRHMGKP